MTLATRCPSCETIFRMTTQEATARGGTVRCGVCGTAFNALDALVNMETLRTQTPITTPDSRPTENLLSIGDAPLESSADAEQLPDQPLSETDEVEIRSGEVEQLTENQDHGDLVIEIAEPAFESDSQATWQPELQPESEDQGKTPSHTQTGGFAEATTDTAFEPTITRFIGDETEPRNEPTLEPDTEAAAAITESPAASATDTLLLSPRSRTYEPGGKPGRRTLFVSLCVLAILALAAQGIYVWRDTIAASWPSARPLLTKTCAALGCRVELPMNIAALSIESSELQAVPQTTNSYNFSTLLRNRGQQALRYPALELTLTDTLDQVVLRRVFLPEQYLNPTQRRQVASGIAPNAELPVRISFDVAGTPIVGYRVGLFYP